MIRISRPTCPLPDKLSAQIYDDPINKGALIQSSYGKCMYCESSVRHIEWGEIEHIKPKEAFPNLAYIWENLGFACPRCNNGKGDKFDEQIAYINPYDEDPNNFIVALGAVILEKETNIRGQKTISDIGLNRKELLEKRHEALQRIQKSANVLKHIPEPQKSVLLNELKEESADEKEFSFIIKQLF